MTTAYQRRATGVLERALDVAMRVIPVGVLVVVGALFIAGQTVKPHHRAIKAAVALVLMALMMRFDMVYSVYLFTLLFVFPSGISIASSNTVLMTVTAMIWAVRAASSRRPLGHRTPLDAPIALFLLAYVVSLFNVDTPDLLVRSLSIIWGQLTACTFFYAIVMFVDDETKLVRFAKIMCVSCALVMTTGALELFFPGTAIIPGWIGLASRFGEGELTYRVEGLRVGGAFQSHGMLSDFGTQLFMFMGYFAITSRNPIEKLLWALAATTAVVAILATANRGAALGFILALVLMLVYFRRTVGVARGLLIGLLTIAVLVAADAFLSERTIAVSVLDRLGATEFTGGVPDTRTMTWEPALRGALEKPFFGHGPYYDVGIGLTKRYWPHNGYLFYFYTLGFVGLGAFLWIVWKVWRESRFWRHPAIRPTRVGSLLGLAQIWFFVMLFEQLRTDHQRDDIYPYIVWMCFGFIVAAASIARGRIATGGEGQGAAASMRAVVSK